MIDLLRRAAKEMPFVPMEFNSPNREILEGLLRDAADTIEKQEGTLRIENDIIVRLTAHLVLADVVVAAVDGLSIADYDNIWKNKWDRLRDAVTAYRAAKKTP